LGEGFKYENFPSNPELETFDMPNYNRYDDDVDGESPEIPDEQPDDNVDTYDQYVGAEVSLPIDGKMMNAKVRGQKRLVDGSVIGRATSNLILDTHTYKVEFPDGQTAEMAANVIAQNIYAMCDEEGNQFLLLSGIIDHQKDESVYLGLTCCTCKRGRIPTSASPLRVDDFVVLSGGIAVPCGKGLLN
jgi:hypothetical protein